MTERAAALRPGYQLGRYQLLLPLAKGGMGQVWAARLTGTRGFQKLVAIKTILPSDGDLQQLELMLFEEASLASRIKHPNVAETSLAHRTAARLGVTREELLALVERSKRAHTAGAPPPRAITAEFPARRQR